MFRASSYESGHGGSKTQVTGQVAGQVTGQVRSGQVRAIGRILFCQRNRPFPSLCLPPLQSESKCKVFVMLISFTYE